MLPETSGRKATGVPTLSVGILFSIRTSGYMKLWIQANAIGSGGLPPFQRQRLKIFVLFTVKPELTFLIPYKSLGGKL